MGKFGVLIAHGCRNSSRRWQEYIVDIRSCAAGFAEAVIRPCMPEKLVYAEAEVTTVRGRLFARSERGAGACEAAFG